MKILPKDRELLLAALTPPSGFKTTAALGTTYTLDATALVAASIAMSGLEWPDAARESEDDTDTEPSEAKGGAASQADPLAMIDPRAHFGAAQLLRDRVRVLYHAGNYRVGRGVEPAAIAPFSDLLVDMKTKGAAFHPKIWLLRFDHKAGGDVPLYRFICTSRNLTLERNWELGAVLEGRPTKAATTLGAAIGSALKAMLVSGLPRPVEALADEARRVDFQLATFTKRTTFHWQDSRQKPKLWDHVPDSFDRALVMAPFVEEKFLDKLLDRCSGRVTVLSNHEGFDRIREWLARQQKVDAHEVRDEVNGTRFPLHAKMLIVEDRQGSRAFIGSTNATCAAWGIHGGGNTEAVMELNGVLRIAEFLKTFCGPEAVWMRPGPMEPGGSPPEDSASSWERTTRTAVASLPFTGRYANATLFVRCPKLPPNVLQVHAHVGGVQRPLQSNEETALPMPIACFSTMIELRVTAKEGSFDIFVAVRVKNVEALSKQRNDEIRQRMPPEDREALFEALLDGSLWRLGSAEGKSRPNGDADDSRERDARPASPGARQTSELEQIVRLCAEDPERLAAVLRDFPELPGKHRDRRAMYQRVVDAARVVKSHGR